METQTTTATSGAGGATSGATDKADETRSEQLDTSGSEDQKSGTDLVAKIKKEKDNYAKRVAELKAELDAKNAELESHREQGLVQKEEFKTLYEREKEARLKREQELAERDKRDQEALKKAAVREHLLKLGLNPTHEKTAFRLMDISTVVVDADTKAVIGSDEAAKAFYDQFKDLGLFGKAGAGVSHTAPGKPATFEHEIRALKTQREYDEYMAKKYGR